MSKTKPDETEQVLSLLRQLLAAIKDENIPEPEADKIVGRLLSKIDKLMERIDGDMEMSPPVINKDHIKSKIQIETPSKSRPSKKAKKK